MKDEIALDKFLIFSAAEVAEIFDLKYMSFLNRLRRDPKSLPTPIKIKGFPPKWRACDIDEFLDKIVLIQQEKINER
jgi:hypothetical protein